MFCCFKQNRQPKYQQQNKNPDKQDIKPIIDKPEQLVHVQQPTKLIPASPKHEQIHNVQKTAKPQKKALKPQEVLWKNQYQANDATVLCQKDTIKNSGFANSKFNVKNESEILFNDDIFLLFKQKNLVQKDFPDPLVKYKILSIMNLKQALDVTSVTDKSKGLRKGDMIIWQYHGGPNQGFYIKHLEGEKVKIINAATGYPIKIVDSSTKEGATIKVNPQRDGDNEVFRLIPHEQVGQQKQNIFAIETFCGKVLDIKGRSTSNGTQVIQWASNNQKNQLWLIIPA